MKIPRGITPMFEFIHPLIPKFPLEQTIKTRNRRLDKDVDLLLKHIKDDKKKENEQIPSQDIQNNKGFNNGDRKSNTISEVQIQKRKKRIKTATNRTILEMIVKDIIKHYEEFCKINFCLSFWSYSYEFNDILSWCNA